VGGDMDDGVIGRWVAMVVSLVFCVGKSEKCVWSPINRDNGLWSKRWVMRPILLMDQVVVTHGKNERMHVNRIRSAGISTFKPNIMELILKKIVIIQYSETKSQYLVEVLDGIRAT
jgi:hypothetical protein